MRWLTLDLALVSTFALIGRASHAEGITAGGWWHTAWPFLAGAVVGWVIVVAMRRAPTSVTGGLVVWATTLTGGMLLRRVDGQGTAVAFVIVATVVLGAMLLGSRLTLALSRRRGSRTTGQP